MLAAAALTDVRQPPAEIYRIVSNKALESSSGGNIQPTAGETISVSRAPDEQKQGGCC